MKLKGAMSIGGKQYKKGETLPWKMVYPFFMVHMGMFGLSGFLMAYSSDGPDVGFLYLHGGFAIFVYLIFYLTIFGREEVKWMFINAGLGLFGIYAEIGWILRFFGTTLEDYPVHVHVIPFLYYVLYTFLLRQAIVDITGSRENHSRRKLVERLYIVISIVVYGTIFLLSS